MAAFVTACGGSGTASKVTAPVANKEAIVREVQNGFATKAMGQSLAGAPAKKPSAPGDVTFNTFYQLWSREFGDGALSYGYDYFEDEALTKPAGREQVVTVIEEDSITQTGTIEILAGPYAGFRSSLVVRKTATTVEYEYTGQSPDLGEFSATGSYQDGRITFETRRVDENGNPRFYRLTVEPDGTSKVEFNSAGLFEYTLNFALDGSGQGTVQNTDGATIATLTWDANGDGTLTFEDGSSIGINAYRIDALP